jgi:hypothetical protein
VRPNNSFKPTPCRGVGHVLYATLAHVRRPVTGRLNSGVRPLLMHMRKLSHVTSYLAVLSVFCVSLYAYYSYKTGCTADLKTGSLGDPQLALHFSSIAMAWLAAGVMSGTVAVSVLPGVEASIRAGLAVAFFFFGSGGFLLLGAYSEAVGLQHCFAA